MTAPAARAWEPTVGVRLVRTSTVALGRRVALFGRLDARGATAARAALHAAVLDGAGDLVVDMSGVDSLDAVGLGVLVATRRLAYRHGRTLVLEGCTPRVAHLLHTTRMHRVLALRGEQPGCQQGADGTQGRAATEHGGGAHRRASAVGPAC
jgi:anti-anti-sigma factor